MLCVSLRVQFLCGPASGKCAACQSNSSPVPYLSPRMHVPTSNSKQVAHNGPLLLLLHAAVSPRMNRLVQQQKLQQQQAKCKRGPKVLRPEGRDRHRTAAPAVAQRSTAAGRSRSPSPGRGSAPDYQLPTEADDLVSVVKIFLQHEVLKCARRNRLAGSPLGHRRAQHKQPNLMRWEALPHGVLRD
jgi:hypothetical protein